MKLSEEDIKKLGILLQNKRRSLNFTLDDVREKLEELGQNANTSDILRIERGERKTPNAILLKNLCKIYSIDVVRLFQEIGYLDIDKKEKKKIKIYNELATAFTNPERYIEEIDLNLNEDIIGIKNNNIITLIEKNRLVENNKNGVYKINTEYFIKKKSMVNQTEFILLGESNEPPIFIKLEDKIQEFGIVIGKIIFE